MDLNTNSPPPSTEALLYMLIERIGNMETLLNTKLDAIEDRLQVRIESVNRDVQNHKMDEVEIKEKINEQKENWVTAERYYSRIHTLEEQYKQLAIKADFLSMNMDKIQNKWKNWLFDFASKVGNKFAWIVLGFVSISLLLVIIQPELIRQAFVLLGVIK